jgi:telomerase reverse transcriptase
MQQSTILENKLADTTKKATSYISAKCDGASSLSDSVPSINTECGIRRNFDRAMPTLASLTPSTGISRDHGVPSTNVDIVGTTKRNNIIHNSNGKGFAMKRRMTSLSAFDSDQESVAKPAKNYFDKCVSTDDVSSFIKSVCRRTFSNEDVWGSRHNMDAFLSNIDSYIRLGRNDTLTIEQIMKKIRITDIPWLQDHAIAAKRTRHGIFTAKVKMILLRTFFYWIICDFVNPLISMHFYVTEGEGMGSIVLFYSRSVWNQMVMDGFKQIKGQFVKMADYSISQHTAFKQNFNEDLMNRLIPTQDILRNIEPASTRFMPKKSSLRLITNMGNKKKTNGSTGSNTKNSNISSSYHTTNNLNSTSANSAAVSNSGLYNCLHVLKHTHQMNPSLSGFGVFGIDEIYKRLLHFRQRVQFDGTQPLYVAVLDLEKCYDNVDTGQLYDLVCTLLDTKGSTENDLFYAPDVYPKADGNDNDSDEEEDCILHKYHITHRINSMERVITKTVRHVSCEGEMFTFDEASGEIAGCYRNSIITDTVQYPRLSKEDILKTIRGHLFNHVVKIPDITSSTNNMATTKAISAGNAKKACDHYTQVKGIPQGSVLSPLLCNLYYGNAERKVFGSKDEIQILGIRDKSLIMRMMDDYIMISLDKDAVTHFLQRAHQSLKPYGGGVNYLKTRVNFDTAIEIEGARLRLQKIDSTRMPWCGFFVDTVTMEVTPSFDRVMGNHLRCSTSIDCSHIGFALRRVMKTFVRMKCHAIVLDSVLNLYNTVFKTVYEIFLVAAIRTHAFILNSKYFRAYNNTNHLFQCIIEAVLFGARLIHSRTAMKKSRRLNLGQDDQKTAQGSLLGHQVNTYKVLVTSSSDNNNMSDTMIKNAKNGSDVQSEQVSGASGCEIPYIQAQWLGYRAFESAFNVKRSLYAPILVQLKKKGDALKHTIETETPFNQENERTLQESNVTLLKDIY